MAIFTIGLTGGLASGKSTVLQLFQQFGIDTFSADQMAHQLISQNGLAYSHIVHHFGQDILDSNNAIDRAKLRKIVFDHFKEKVWLENYLHPLVRAALLERRNQSSSSYVMIEIPLLAESKTPYEWIDRILVVDADQATQQLRAKNRSGLSKEASEKILNQQAPREKRNAIADDIITNQGDLLELEAQVNHLHQKYLTLAAR